MTSAYDYYHDFEYKLMEKCVSENLQRYAKTHMLRFFHTLDLIKCFIPKDKSKLSILDIGPFLPFTLTCKEILEDLFGKTIAISTVELPSGKGLQYASNIQVAFCNIEQEPLNLNLNSFDLVLMLEILEHFIQNPYYALCQSHRLLKRGWGVLVLSTPNVASLRNRLKLGFGGNIYDLYSRESVYGRHNREYDLIEVKELLRNSGFEIIKCYSHSFYPQNKGTIYKRALRRSYYLFLNSLIRIEFNIGDNIFCVAKKTENEPNFPEWLYRYSPGLQSMFK